MGIRVFAGLRWDPFILDAPAALRTIATGELACSRMRVRIYLDGKNVLSIVVELDCARFLGDARLVAVVAETRTRGSLSVRIERVGRPEVKNMMLGPKQHDRVNRDLEIRDLYNMEDAFSLGESYQGAYRARLNANLAFWPLAADGARTLDRARARGLPRRRRHVKPYVEQGSFLEPEVAVLRGAEHQTCGGRTLNDDVMDRFFTLVVNAGNGPTIRDGVDASTMTACGLSFLAAPNPRSAETPTSALPLRWHGREHGPIPNTARPGARRHPERRPA